MPRVITSDGGGAGREPVSAEDNTPLALLAAGAVCEVASVLVLWLGTQPWTDYLFVGLFSLALALMTVAGFAWIDGVFARKEASLSDAAPRTARLRGHDGE